jgi:hypothetical protein
MSSNDMYVVFEDDDKHWWSWFLKSGIRHCYIIKPEIDNFIVYGRTSEKFDLFNAIDKNDIITPNSIVIGYKSRPVKRSLFMLNTCVGHTKQLLGINSPLILTPYQLLKYLRLHNEVSKST